MFIEISVIDYGIPFAEFSSFNIVDTSNILRTKEKSIKIDWIESNLNILFTKNVNVEKFHWFNFKRVILYCGCIFEFQISRLLVNKKTMSGNTRGKCFPSFFKNDNKNSF